ncbi:MAG: peptidoglycan-binding domain-containing protein [Thiotrichaceae bacterium]|nr:peptidoglycan-binding domain-containing protein [Thiotrichaceae bacterium]
MKADNPNNNSASQIACEQKPELCQPATQQTASNQSKNNHDVIISEQLLKEAQRILQLLRHNKQPYYHGNLTGRYDDQTRAALIDFQHDSGISQENGQLSEETIDKLKIAESDMNLSSDQPTTPIPSQNTNTTIPNFKDVSNLSNDELYELTAYLKELGYYIGNIADAIVKKPEIEQELANFQKIFNKSTPMIITDETWNRLRRIELSSKVQSEFVNAAKGTKQITNNTVISVPATKPTQITNTTQPIKIVKNNQQTSAISQPKKTNNKQPTVQKSTPQPALPPLPTFQLVAKQNVFAIENVKCKNKNAAWITFYEGEVQNIENNQIQVKLSDRYALWYDSRKDGISYGDWWCIPRQRFCYAKVKFSDWGGKLKTGENYTVDKNKVIPIDTKLGRDEGIAALSAELADKQCGFKKKR